MSNVNYNAIRAGDIVLTASSKFACRIIRLRARWNIADMFRMTIPNHAGIIVDDDGTLAIAEMLSTGLEINPLEDYTRDTKHDRIICILRHPNNTPYRVDHTQKTVRSWWHYGIEYGRLKLLKFIGINVDDTPSHRYCSEMVEVAANAVGLTWCNWNLVRLKGAKRRVDPYDFVESGIGQKVDWELK